MIYVYALIDPFTCKIRYIGKTIRLKQRLERQCNEKSHTHRCYWIQGLISKGKKPIQRILQTLNDNEDWQTVEIKWIAIARKYGWNLVNSTDGGDGVVNLPIESKERILKAWKGKKHKPETIELFKYQRRGKPQTDAQKMKVSDKMKHREITWKDKLQLAVRKFDDDKIQQVKQDLNNGMKVIEAAKKYNVHRSTISKIKAGTYKTFVSKTKNYIKPRMYHLK